MQSKLASHDGDSDMSALIQEDRGREKKSEILKKDLRMFFFCLSSKLHCCVHHNDDHISLSSVSFKVLAMYN